MAKKQAPEFNDIEINIPSDLVFERVVRESAVVVAKHLGFSEERVADLQLAVSEAVTNAIEHGNNCDVSIKVGVKFFISSDQLAVQVTDKGKWDASSTALNDVPLELDMEDRLEQDLTRGMGMFLIQKLVDNVELRSNEEGTEFTMWFNIERGPNNISNLNIAMKGPDFL
ncbi:MAG: ATP-binding protein [Chloroflexota bacterium]|nr:ATP-binding protein [Chloroflexota bacterium]